MKGVQYLTDEQLRYARTLKAEQILRFLDEFRQLHGGRAGADRQASTQINLRIPTQLLRAFRAKAALSDIPYQRQIKRLMEEWTGLADGGIRAVKGGPKRRDLDNVAEVLAWAEGDDRK